MLIQCEKCSTRYNLDEAKIPGKGAKVTCPSCKHVFIVMKGQGAAAPAAPPPAADPTRRPSQTQGKSLLDNFFDDSKTVAGDPFGSQAAPPAPAASLGNRGIRSWKVRVASGLVYDFTDVATLKAWITEHKVTTADQISADGATWTVIGSIPNLDAFFGGTLAEPPRNAPTSQSGALPNAPPPAATPSMGAPGPAPATGFGPPPANAPAAPAFAAPAAGGSLADLFNAPAPTPGGPDPFGGNGAPAAAPAPGANPFAPAASPMQPAPTLGANPFGPPSAPPASANPFGGSAPDPFAAPQAPGANPFGAGAPDPFAAAPPPAAAAPPAPAFGADPFGAAPGPFGAAPGPFGAAPDPFAAPPPGAAGPAPVAPPPPPMMGPKPAPPPWLSGPAPTIAPPAAPSNAPPAPFASTTEGAPLPPPVVATAKPSSWSSAGDAAMPAPIPTGKPRRIGRTVGFAVGGIAVFCLFGGLVMNLDRVRAMLRPIPVPVETPTPPPIVLTLEGEARDHYLRGRRLLRVDDAESYAKAEAEFRAALAMAHRNPRASAGVLEALALQKQAGAAITDDALARAQAEAVGALKDDPQGLETNRALAQLDAVSGKTADALARLETALAARPGDPESLFLRSKLRAADPAQAEAAAEDLAAAAADPTLTRAAMAKAEGAKPKSPEQKALDALTAANAATVAAISGGTWSATPEELERLLPGVPLPTPTPAAVASAVAAESAAPTPATSATPEPAASVVAETPTPAKTAVAVVSATPRKTPVAAPSRTPKPVPTATRTPLAAVTSSEPNWEATPAPTATPDGTEIATASAADHFLAAQAFEMASSWPDAISEYEQAVKLAPKSSKYRLALAAAQMRGGKLQAAATTLANLIDAEPKNASAHQLLGLLFESTGQNSNACAEFSEYLRLKPRAPDAGDIRTRMVRNGCG